MPAHPHRTTLRRSLAWLLWLALVLPSAQVLAACHALTHAGGALGDLRSKQAAHEVHCELCLMAAAVSGSAPAPPPPGLPPRAAAFRPPAVDFGVAVVARPVRAYLSQAPPLARN